MKGLLLKDLCLLKSQKNFFIMILIFACFFAMTIDPMLIMSYSCFIVSAFTAGTITYDEYNNGFSFLFSLPITRKQYITEKFLFSLIFAFIVLFVSFVGFGIYQWIEIPTFDIREWMLVCGFVLIAAIILTSIMIPFYLKFGGEKGRIALFVFVFIIAGLIVFSSRMFTYLNIDLSFLFQLDKYILIASLLPLPFIIIGLSYMISLKILMKKEF